MSDGQEHSLKDIRAYCADSFNLSEEDRAATIPSGKNMVIDRVGWARTHLKKAGLIESPQKATFVITPLGKEVLQKGTESVHYFIVLYEMVRCLSSNCRSKPRYQNDG